MVATVREPGRLPGLDALRGLAALGVLIWHYGGHFGATPWGDALRPFFGAGLYLVDVFFVLSGFLLAQLYQCAAAVPEFLFKRACRLFPLHWVTLLAVMGLQRLHEAWTGAPFVYRMNDAFHFGLNVLLVQSSGLQHGFSFNGPAWSISVEWIVNLGFAGVLCVAAWRFRLAMGLALLALAGLGWGQGHLIGEGVLGGVWDAALVRGVFGFFLGVALAGCLPACGAGPARGWFWDGVGILAGAVLLYFMSSPVWQGVKGLDFVVVGLGVPLLIAGCSRGRGLARLCRAKPLLWLGEVSFSVYLWHFPLQIAFALAQVKGWGPDYGSPATLLLFVGLSYALAWVSWVGLERPILAWGRAAWPGKKRCGT